MRRPLVIFAGLLSGCAAAPTSSQPAAVSIGAQLQKQDAQLIGQHFRTVLDFENRADAAFVRSAANTVADGHTGAAAFRSASTCTVNVSSLLFGLTLPADWSLLGGYVRPAADGPVTATLIADGRAVASTTRRVPAGAWAFAAVELTAEACRTALPGATAITLQFEAQGGFDLDDVMLVDNRRTLVGPPAAWTIEQVGLSIAVMRADRPPLHIASPAAAADGWSVEEANAVRLRLRDATGRHQWTLFPDGRSTVDGRPSGATDNALAPQTAPADVNVDAATGRLDRETPGDVDNDGYNEHRGAYQVVATSPRLRVRLTPHPVAVAPVFEIHGLVADASAVTVDGRLIESFVRLTDGTLLFMLPLRVERPIEITVGVTGG